MEKLFKFRVRMSRNGVLEVKTVIIGAGMAGISASINLLANGYDDFVVFEAIERIGGRFHNMTNGELNPRRDFRCFGS